MAARTSPSEHAIQARELVDLSSMEGGMFWRNNTGRAWQGRDVTPPVGRTVTIKPGMMVLDGARPVRFGLVGSGDIIGTLEGRAVAVEVKSDTGEQEESQILFEKAWTKAGGIYILTTHVGDARTQLQQKIDMAR